MKKHYIKAVVALLLEGKDVDVVLKDLKAALARKGHQKLHADILKGVTAELALQGDAKTSAVVVAKENDLKTEMNAINEALASLGGDGNGDMRVSVDATLIGGFIASHNGKLINRSHKEHLVSLYRRITK
jgi:F0F1-type ATP synthase delta subunit